MDVIECIATRRSIRHFLDLPVDQETILTIVEAGTYAPNAGNLQDWKFIVVDDKTLMKSISEYSLSQSSVHNAAFLIVICSDPEQTERHYGLRGERLYTIQNCAAAAQNMLLAAHSTGIGGVWIGAFDENKIRDMLNIPGNARPQAVLAFGYPAEVPGHKMMKDLALITFFNKYGLKIKNVHRLLRDYHVDWEKRINQAHNAIDRFKEKTAQTTKETTEVMKKHSESMFSKLKTKLSENLKPKK